MHLTDNQLGMVVRWVGVPNHEHDPVTGKLFFPRCDNVSCLARPPYVVLLTEGGLGGVRVVNTLRLCRHHTESFTGRPVFRTPRG